MLLVCGDFNSTPQLLGAVYNSSCELMASPGEIRQSINQSIRAKRRKFAANICMNLRQNDADLRQDKLAFIWLPRTEEWYELYTARLVVIWPSA